MVARLLPKEVADAFVRQYYVILDRCPENVYKFYQEPSHLSWPGPDGTLSTVTTLSKINEKIMASDHKNGIVEINTVDAQDSHDEAVIVAVTGTLAAKGGVKKYFSQTFFLAKQEIGFFVRNDILRILDITSSVTNVSANDGGNNDQPAVSQKKISVPGETPEDAASLGNKAEVEKNKAKSLKHPVIKRAVAERAVSKSFVDSPDTLSLSSSDGKASSVAGLASNATPKITYASMVAKEVPVTSPKTSGVPSNLHKQATEVSTHGKAASLAKATPRSPKAGNGASPANVNGETKGIYIGRLPYDISKQGIVDVVKQFGTVKRNAESVQIRRHEDGFCCGFVEFESAESARRAVEAHRLKFGGKEESYITYKRANRSNGSGRRPPQRAGFRTYSFKGGRRRSPPRYPSDGRTSGGSRQGEAVIRHWS